MTMRTKPLLLILFCCCLAGACRKKHNPQATSIPAESSGTPVVAAAKKPVARKKIKTPVPTVITVDDRAAHKVSDGRLYYDLEGKRYWKNYKDGKYYLFNKNMYNDPAFKPQ